jgi:hypothetical protein
MTFDVGIGRGQYAWTCQITLPDPDDLWLFGPDEPFTITIGRRGVQLHPPGATPEPLRARYNERNGGGHQSIGQVTASRVRTR